MFFTTYNVQIKMIISIIRWYNFSKKNVFWKYLIFCFCFTILRRSLLMTDYDPKEHPREENQDWTQIDKTLIFFVKTKNIWEWFARFETNGLHKTMSNSFTFFSGGFLFRRFFSGGENMILIFGCCCCFSY